MTVEKLTDYREIIDVIRASGGEAFKFCYECGKCDVVCPWNRVRNFSIRRIMREAVFGMTDIESEDIWLCTTCGLCPRECPRDVRQVESGVSLRRIAAEYGVYPASVKPIRGVSSSLMGEGNPLNEKREDRAKWTDGLSVKPFSEEMELLYFPGCYLSYDPRLKKVARATAGILDAADVEFGILGAGESCCGESVRKAGGEDVFRALAKENIKTFVDHGVKKILVSSPHCYHTFANEYPEFMVNFEVTHISRYLAELVREGRLEIAGEYRKTVAYHDPCYLGRHNGIYDEPREVLGKIPGLDLREMPDTREGSLCCGGGGGRVWMETPRSERFSDLRVGQAAAAGASVLATSCPYCITMFEESRLGLAEGEAVEVKDITEIVRDALKGNGKREVDEGGSDGSDSGESGKGGTRKAESDVDG